MNNWKTVAVPSNTSIETAICVLHKGCLGIVLATAATIVTNFASEGLLRRMPAVIRGNT